MPDGMRWRRLDMPGDDQCRLLRLDTGWRLEGLAQFGAAPHTAHLEYVAEVDQAWRARRATVHGTVGGAGVDRIVERSAVGHWRINGEAAVRLRGLVDLDLGFTPATNLFPLRRLALAPGQGADAEAAWLDDTGWSFVRLPQRYERHDAEHYWYESPTAGYSALLTVTSEGFVRDYPGLWTAVDEDS